MEPSLQNNPDDVPSAFVVKIEALVAIGPQACVAARRQSGHVTPG